MSIDEKVDGEHPFIKSDNPTFLQVRRIVVNQTGLKEELARTITPLTSLKEDAGNYGWDSLDIVEATMSLEEHYDDITIPKDELDKMRNLGDLSVYLERNIDPSRLQELNSVEYKGR